MSNPHDQFRQGDVFVVRVAATPQDATGEVHHDRTILAAGESTGHHHAMPLSDAAILARGAQRYLRVRRRSELTHEEHGPIQIARGSYEITIQVEYDPTVLARAVVD